MMAAIGGFPGQDHSHELRVYLGATAAADAVEKYRRLVGPKLACCKLLVDGEKHSAACPVKGWAAETDADDTFYCCGAFISDPHADDCGGWEKPGVMVAAGEVKATGEGGWAWGDTSGGQWLTIPGSANMRPRLGRSPGTAYLVGPKQATMNTVCAYVVPTPHSGVSTGVAFRIAQFAEEREMDLAAVLAYEDQEEDAGVLDADDRTTCHVCKAWATDEHVAEGAVHWARLDAAAQLAEFVEAMK